MVLAMASFAWPWPSVMVLKGSRLLVGRTILKCSWQSSQISLIGSEMRSFHCTVGYLIQMLRMNVSSV